MLLREPETGTATIQRPVIMQYNSIGDITWARQYSTNDIIDLYQIECSPAQLIFAFGEVQSTSLSQQSSQTDIIIIKLYSNGDVIWVKTVFSTPKSSGTSWHDQFGGALLSQDGYYIYLVSYTDLYSQSSPGGAGKTNLKFNKISASDGTLIISKGTSSGSFGLLTAGSYEKSGALKNGNSLAFDYDNINLFVLRTVVSPTNVESGSILKLDNNLDSIYQISFQDALSPTKSDNLVKVITASQDKTMFIGGNFNKAKFTATSSQDILITKMSSKSGQLIWAQNLYSTQNDCLLDMILSPLETMLYISGLTTTSSSCYDASSVSITKSFIAQYYLDSYLSRDALTYTSISRIQIKEFPADSIGTQQYLLQSLALDNSNYLLILGNAYYVNERTTLHSSIGSSDQTSVFSFIDLLSSTYLRYGFCQLEISVPHITNQRIKKGQDILTQWTNTEIVDSPLCYQTSLFQWDSVLLANSSSLPHLNLSLTFNSASQQIQGVATQTGSFELYLMKTIPYYGFIATTYFNLVVYDESAYQIGRLMNQTTIRIAEDQELSEIQAVVIDADGNPLDKWLVFHPSNYTFVGIPKRVQQVVVSVTLTDKFQSGFSGTFIIEVTSQSLVIIDNPSNFCGYLGTNISNSVIQLVNVFKSHDNQQLKLTPYYFVRTVGQPNILQFNEASQTFTFVTAPPSATPHLTSVTIKADNYYGDTIQAQFNVAVLTQQPSLDAILPYFATDYCGIQLKIYKTIIINSQPQAKSLMFQPQFAYNQANFMFQIPSNWFTDPDQENSKDTLSIEATIFYNGANQWLQFYDTGDVQVLLGKPMVEQIGTSNAQSVVIRATDQYGLYVESILGIVIQENSWPYVSNKTALSYTYLAGQQFMVQLRDQFQDIDADLLTYSLVQQQDNNNSQKLLPDWIKFNPNSLIISGVAPTNVFGNLTNKSYSFKLYVNDKPESYAYKDIQIIIVKNTPPRANLQKNFDFLSKPLDHH
eukprot:403331625